MNLPSHRRWIDFLHHHFFPIQRRELPKFFALACMMFCVLLNYTLVRNLKDTLVITGTNSSAEVITFIKVWLVMPAALLSVFLIGWLSNHISRKNFFFVITAPFWFYFLIHAFLLLPSKNFLHPRPESIASLQQSYAHLRWVFPLWGNWTNVLFYVFAEIWGSACFYYLFWQVAIQVTTKLESVRFFSLFGLLGNGALVVSGRLGQIVSNHYKHLLHDEFYVVVQTIILCFSVSLLFAYGAAFFLFRRVIVQDKHFSEDFIHESLGLKQKNKVSFREQMTLFTSSAHLRYLVLIVFSYGFLINLLESLWKNQVKFMATSPMHYNTIMARYSESTGWSSILLMFIGGWILRKKGWKLAALTTPICILLLGGVFMIASVCRYYAASSFLFVSGPEKIAVFVVFVGFVANVLAKATKYSFYDPSKELVYINLQDDLKSKGKIVVDLLGARSGKASASLYQQVLLLITAGTQLSISPFTGGMFILVAFFWCFVVLKLDRLTRILQ